MNIKKIRLWNFRNYESEEIEFSENLNIIYGENAQGKTNILEAVFLCSAGRSHRTARDTEMIRFSGEKARVEVVFHRENYGDFTVEVDLTRDGKKGVRVNGVPLKRMGDIMGYLNCVIFSPEDLGVIKDEPQVRRRFLDMFISQVRPAYFFNLHQYNKVLHQRNALLKQIRENRGLLGTMAAWDASLAELGTKIIMDRRFFTEKISIYAEKNHAGITGEKEKLTVLYTPSVKFSAQRDANEEEIQQQFLRGLERNIDVDIARLATQTGPHKDDLTLLLNGIDLKHFGSQGQQRTAALALKMAQVDVMAEEAGGYPVLLLDDVMSELDPERQESLSVNMKKAQTFITGTEKYIFRDAAVSAPDTAYFQVSGGKIV